MNVYHPGTPLEILTLAKNAARRSNLVGQSRLRKAEKTSPYRYQIERDDKIDTYSVPEGNVILALMVGSRRCGKTTLMVSIVKEFRNVMGDDFRIEPVNSHTSETFKNMEAELEQFARAPKFVSGIQPNESIETYEFLLYCKQHPRSLFLLRFIDVPGEWVRQYPDAMQILVDSADMLYFTINTPALLEDGGAYSDEINAPENVLNVAKILYESKQPRRRKLMLFVPTKCEKYYWRQIEQCVEGEMTRVTNAVNAMYEPLITQIRSSETLRKQLTIATIPVLTIGGVIFSLFRRELRDGVSGLTESYVFTDGHNDGRSGYRPRLCEQPMLYSMRFFREIARKRIENGRFGGFIKDIKDFKFKTAFRYAFNDPLYLRLKQVTALASFEGFSSPDDFREAERGRGATRELPKGVYVNVEALGITMLNDPDNLFGARMPEGAEDAPQK